MLNSNERVFLENIGYDSTSVFDGRYMTAKDAKARAKQEGCDLMLGSPCAKAGHRIRTRHGHCLQCDTSKLAHFTRYSQDGYVYIARSKSHKLIKIGVCSDISRRETSLNGYANANDWEMCLYFWAKSCGRIEQKIQNELSKYSTLISYSKHGRPQEAKEVFTCSFVQAYDALNKTLFAMQVKPEKAWMRYADVNRY